MTGNCKRPFGNIVPEILVRQKATLEVFGLDDRHVVNLRINKCILTVGKQKYEVIPENYTDNRITHAKCNISTVVGGRRRHHRKSRKSHRKHRRTTRRH